MPSRAIAPRRVDSFCPAPEHLHQPGIGISLTVLSVNSIGDGLRDALDPRFRGR